MLMSVLFSLAALQAPPQPRLALWYDRPTAEYMSGLPVGDGRIGAMVLGEPGHARIALNDLWLWRGKTRDRTPCSRAHHQGPRTTEPRPTRQQRADRRRRRSSVHVRRPGCRWPELFMRPLSA